MSEVKLLRAEVAARRRSCTCPYWPESDEIKPTPNCLTHGVDEHDRQILTIRAVEALRDLVEECDETYQTKKGNAWDHARSALWELDRLAGRAGAG